MAQQVLSSASVNGLGDEGDSNETTPLTPFTPLLTFPRPNVLVVPAPYVHRVLFLSFSASVAIAATAPTTVYAYAYILCRDPTHCKDGEEALYAGASALATVISNSCGILALGPLQKVMKPRPKAGLYLWMVARASSVAVLVVAVTYKSIVLALVGRIFEGFATDNLLHFILNSIYISVGDTNHFSQLMGTSLALYMVGMFSSPIVAGLFANFFSSFIMALSIFAISIMYIALLVPMVEKTPVDVEPETLRNVKVTTFGSIQSLIGPLVNLFSNKGSLLIGLALLFFNMSQAYLFPALMVFGSLRFSFTGRQNGYLISIAAGVSAFYLLIVSYGFPKLRTWLRKKHVPTRETGLSDEEETSENAGWRRPWNRDYLYAVLSMLVQVAVLPCIMLTTAAWQVFALVSFLALGLAAPSFIKSYGASLVNDGPVAVASWAMMESLGGLLSALVLGGWQNIMGIESVFFIAAGLVSIAIVLITVT
ncbi:MFS general substrate transporter [Nemania sp. FL0031]|nr:MFS general substrate transporter [Nemania sp. FL0031]